MDEALRQFFRSLAPFSDAELEEAGLFFRQKALRKNEFFCKAGQFAGGIAFVKEGILRSFFQIEEKETTTFFQIPGSIAVALKSFVRQEKSSENIQALTDAVLMVISRDDLYYLYNENWKWQQVGRVLIEDYYIHQEQRMTTLQSLTAQERYAQFFASYPRIFQHVPLQYVASYLGVSPETLSRIRKSL